MGQNQSANIKFADCWSASGVTRGRIDCKKSCMFTQYSSSTFTTDRETSLVCKVYENNDETIAFGLVPPGEKSGCRDKMVGQRGIYGSIGCHVTKSTVSLLKNGNCFFEGKFNAKGVFTITMKINHGKLTFFVDNHKVNSEELEEMTFNERYMVGVSMRKAGQMAEVFFACPVNFLDIWSAGDVTGEMLSASKSTNFTIFSQEVLQPKGRYTIFAKVLRNCRNSVGLGIVPIDCKEMCRDNLPGMQPRSMACLIKNGMIVIMINGDVKFVANPNANDVKAADSCLIKMTIDDGQLSFDFDGKGLDCDDLKSIRLTDAFRIGVGLSCAGQVVEMRGDGRDTGSITASSTENGEKDGELDHLISILADKLLQAAGGSGNELRWKDNMRSIDCDQSDRVAVCVKKFTATLYSQCVVEAKEHHSIDIRILKVNPRQLMMVGVMDENTDNHDNNHLGASELNNSLGVTNRGDLILTGSTYATGTGFGEGDLVTLTFHDGNLSIKVNGTEAVSELGNLSFQRKFRWAVSLTEVGQAVKIGSGDLTAEEASFCAQHGVYTSIPSADHTEVSNSSNDSHEDLSSNNSHTDSSDQLKSTISSTQSNSDMIAGCFIDVDDLKYGGESLGKGSFGKVYRGNWDDSDVAIKEIPLEDDEAQLREIAVGRVLTQPNIATILGWSRKGDDKLLVVMPLFRKGSLADRIAQVNKSATPSPSIGGPFGFKFVFRISLGLLRAIKYLATRKPRPVVHRDIKPANILLDDNDQPMLTDFGTARSLKRSVATTHVGTPFYMAAEQAKNEGTTPATDVHAAALVIYEVLCAPRPVRDASNMITMMNDIGSGVLPPLHDVPKEIVAILKPAFSANPRERPTAAEMISRFESVRSKFESR